MSKPRKINDVLARFEQTIQENEAAGGGGGMYLTNVASSRKTQPRTISSRSLTGEAVGPASRGMTVSAGSYRNFLHSDGAGGKAERDKPHQQSRGDSTVSTASISENDWGDRDWDPFAEEEDGDQSENDYSDEEGEQGEERRVSRHRRATRPCSSKRMGRLGNRKTRTGRSDPRARNDRDGSLEDVAEVEYPDTCTNNEETDDGFAVKYVSGADRESSRGHCVQEKPGDHHRTGSSAHRSSRNIGSSGGRPAARRPCRR